MITKNKEKIQFLFFPSIKEKKEINKYSNANDIFFLWESLLEKKCSLKYSKLDVYELYDSFSEEHLFIDGSQLSKGRIKDIYNGELNIIYGNIIFFKIDLNSIGDLSYKNIIDRSTALFIRTKKYIDEIGLISLKKEIEIRKNNSI